MGKGSTFEENGKTRKSEHPSCEPQVGMEALSDCVTDQFVHERVYGRGNLFDVRVVEPLASGAGQIQRHFRRVAGPAFAFVLITY